MYDGENELREARSLSDGASEVYFYDHAGQRMLAARTAFAGAPAEVRFWFGATEATYRAAAVPTWGVFKTRLHTSLGTMPVAQIDDRGRAAPRFVYNGVLGSLLALLAARAAVLARFSYGPYGEILWKDGPEAADQHRRFNGKELDDLSRLGYYGFRYYDRLSLTWTQADPLYRFAPDIAYDQPRRMGLYTFVLNNPLRYVDPDGRDGDGFWGTLGGFFEAVGEGVWEAVTNPGDTAKAAAEGVYTGLGCLLGCNDAGGGMIRRDAEGNEYHESVGAPRKTFSQEAKEYATVAALSIGGWLGGKFVRWAGGKLFGSAGDDLARSADDLATVSEAELACATGCGPGSSVAASSVRQLTTPGGRKLAQQIARFRAAGGTGGRAEFLQHASDLAARAREAGSFVTGTVGRGPQAIPNATIFREGRTFLVVDEAGVIRSFVPNASPGGIVDEFIRLGGSL